MKRRLKVETDKNGNACLFEFGGAIARLIFLGAAQIITGPNGEKKEAELIKSGSNIANGNHALIPIEVGDYVINVTGCNDMTLISIYKITSIDEDGVDDRCCAVETIEENSTAARLLEPAIVAALEKAETLHCRKAMYIKEIS